MSDTYINQLTDVIEVFETALSASIYGDCSDALTETEVSDLQTRCITAIERASGTNSTYHKLAIQCREQSTYIPLQVQRQIGVAKALLSDIQNDYLKSYEELIHSDVFSDLLEMADHLLEKGYKDAAAVLAGSTLEVHIKKLCKKFGVETLSNGRTKKTESLNTELRKQEVYTELDRKNVSAWLGLRNHAAHGNYSEYQKEQVQLLVNSVRDFITRNPA